MNFQNLLRLVISLLCAVSVTSVNSAKLTSLSAAGDSVVSQPRFDSGKPMSVGLVLSGGGAKGIAHIGVIKALEEHNIPIDFVAGTSMGAIVGGLYSMGFTTDEMLKLIESPEFNYWATGNINPEYEYYFAKNEPTPAFTTVNFGDRDSTQVTSMLPTSLISPLPMNFGFMMIFSAYTAQINGDFNNLFVPFRCVTSDVYTKRKVVCRSGQLGDAIRASMTFPLVFRPIEMNGTLMYDGGIYDNFPVDVMKSDFAPDIIIGVNVTNADTKPKANDVIQQLEDMIIQNNDYSLPAEEGIKIQVDVSDFNLLDFGKAPLIYQRGYEKAMEMIDSVESRVTSRISPVAREVKRQVFKDGTPYLRFDSVSVTGGTRGQNEYLKYLFTHNMADTFGIVRARDSYYRAITPGQLSNLIPTAVREPGDSLFTLNLDATVKNGFRAGAGGYISSSTSSMLFFNLGYNTLSFNSFDAGVNAWVGQSYLAAQAYAKFMLLTHNPSYLKVQGVLSREKFHESDKMFYDMHTPTFVTNSEAFMRLNYCMAAGRKGIAELSLGGAHLTDRFYQADIQLDVQPGRDKVVSDYVQLRGAYDLNTLNRTSYPTAGGRVSVVAMGVYGNQHFTPYDPTTLSAENSHPLFLQAELKMEGYRSLHKHFILGGTLDILGSTRKLPRNYSQAIVEAPAFLPTASSYNAFNQAFRANSYAAAGVVPIWNISQYLQLRGTFNVFLPLRRIEANENHEAVYGKWLANPEFFGELAAVVNLPFGSLSAYGNYQSYPSNNWNCGISLGIFILAPKFLR